MGAKKKNPNAVALGSLGGKARAKSLTGTQRSEIATKAAKARTLKLSATERSAIAKHAVDAREAQRRKNGGEA